MKIYPKMKDSGVEWIGEIPEHWDITKIKFTSYVKGRIGWQGLRSDEFTDKGPLLVTGTDFENGKINWNTCHHVDQWRYDQDPHIQLREKDILITKDGTIGKVAKVEQIPAPTTLNTGVMVIRPLKDTYLSEFIFWMLQSSIFLEFINWIKTGSTIHHLYQESFNNFQFVLPKTLEEQKQIANFLDKKTTKIDSDIQKNQRLVELLKEKRQSTINQTVTKGLDPTVPMKDSCVDWIGEIPKGWNEKRLKFSIFLRSDKSRDSNSRPYIGLENITSKNGKLIDVNNEMNESDSKLFEEKDVLLGKLRPYLAKVWNAEFAGRCSSEFLVFKGIDYESKFLSLLLLSDGTIKNIDASTYGAKMPRAEWSFIGNMVLPVPPKEEQNEIARFLEKETSKIDSLISKTESQIEKIQEFRQALITSAVTGKIDVREAIA
ncbi:restriction endonuclease subunit S [Nitrosopumilus sp. K4]|uniref:restriction endonuclease subunit S n=1 Tax=Nitrosopumilus sp. K4 TaxID=2795383 RepID=UPI001BA86A96|nr:restriction endonuclease subunit S [Nitrosopumilus sp. K4]QUC64379.1 restriction endonuclease subunit S [Nitrosopumilus sp. K4]